MKKGLLVSLIFALSSQALAESYRCEVTESRFQSGSVFGERYTVEKDCGSTTVTLENGAASAAISCGPGLAMQFLRRKVNEGNANYVRLSTILQGRASESAVFEVPESLPEQFTLTLIHDNSNFMLKGSLLYSATCTRL